MHFRKMLFIKLLLLFKLLHLILGYEKNVVGVIKEFIKHQPPTKILAFLHCWNTPYKVNFVEALRNNHVLIKRFDGNIQLLEYSNNQMFILDSRCNNHNEILNEANTRGLFLSPYRWMFIGSPENISTHLDILIDSRFYVVQQTPPYYSIKAIYKISKIYSEYIHNDVALWNKEFLYYNKVIDARNRSDLRKAPVNVSYVLTNPDTLNHIWDYRFTHVDTISKMGYLMCYYVLESLNATGNFIPTPTWGYKNTTTGIYSGMIGALQSGEAEVGGTVCFFTHERLEVIEYFAPVAETRTVFIFRAPPLSYVTNVFVLPFTKSVWYACFALIAILCAILYVIAKWEWSEEELTRDMEITRGTLLPDFLEVFIVNLGGVTQQGSEAEPRSAAGRITYLFGFVAMMFLYTSYSANIVALLQSTSDSINTAEDLLYSRIKLGVEIAPYSYYYFQTATDPIKKALYEQKIAPKGTMENFMDVPTGVKRMRDEFFAMHAQATGIYKIVSETFQENEKCALKEISVWQMTSTQLPGGKNSTYKELLKTGFRKMHEIGIQQREFTRLFTDKPACQGFGSNFINVGLIDCYCAFLIFGIGCAIALILFILEVLLHRKHERLEKSYEKATECFKKKKVVHQWSNEYEAK